MHTPLQRQYGPEGLLYSTLRKLRGGRDDSFGGMDGTRSPIRRCQRGRYYGTLPARTLFGLGLAAQGSQFKY
eukprot:307615-Prorocentrum_minimum.AAC.3